MSEIYGYRAQFDSGGISGPSSTIIVTFPSGSTNVTLTGGGKTWKPIQQDSTSAVYQVKWTGTSITYTASATSDGTTESVSATVSQAYEFIEIKISFGPEWYITLKKKSVGETLTVDGMVWLLVNKTSSAATLGLNTVYSVTSFGSGTAYAGSTLASVAANFETQNLSTETKQYLNNVTVSGVSAKVFVPTKDQLNGGFAYYNSDTRRIAMYQGQPKAYWTSTAYNTSRCYLVDSGNGGNFDDGGITYEQGFRPHMEVNLTL